MKQINECLDRLFLGKKRLKKKWQGSITDNKLLRLYHYHHLIMVYDLKEKTILYEWWEKQADKRGLVAAKRYMDEGNWIELWREGEDTKI